MNQLFKIAGLCLLLLCLSAVPALAGEYSLAQGGPIFGQAVTPPAKAVFKGPLNLPLVRASSQRDYLYLFVNGRPLFDDPGTVFGNTFNQTDWLTAQAVRPDIWNWTLPGRVARLNLGDSLYESAQKGSSLYLIAITQLADGVILLRRQLNLIWPGFKAAPSMDAADLVNRFLAVPGVSVQSRLDGVIYLANKGRLLDPAFKQPLKLPVIERNLSLKGDAAAGRRALKALAVDQEKAMSAKVKSLLEGLIAASGGGDR